MDVSVCRNENIAMELVKSVINWSLKFTEKGRF